MKNQLIGKDPDAWKDRRQEEKGRTEDEIVRHHQLSGHGFEETLGDSEGQGSVMSIESMGLQSQTQFEQMNTTTYKSSSVWVVLGCSGVILGEFGVLLRAPPKPFP